MRQIACSIVLASLTLTACATRAPAPRAAKLAPSAPQDVIIQDGNVQAGTYQEPEPSAPRRGSDSWGFVEGTYGTGDATWTTDNPGEFPVPGEAELDSANIWRFRLQGSSEDALFGLEVRGHDADYLEDAVGVPPGAQLETSMIEVTPLFGLGVGGAPRSGERFGAALRLGIPFQAIEAKSNGILRGPTGIDSVEADWLSVGLRIEAEPEVRIFDSKNFSISAYGRVAAAVYGSALEVDIASGGQQGSIDLETTGTELFGEAGVRLRANSFFAFAGYQTSKLAFDDGDFDLDIVVFEDIYPSTDFEFDGFVFGGGFLF